MTIINPGIACLTIRSAPRPAPAPIGWHNGFYLTQVGESARPQIKAEIQEFDCFRGIMFRYSWNDIETDVGQYNGIAAHILPDLAEIAALSSGANRKRVIIMFHLRQTVQGLANPNTAGDVVPTWMIGNPVYGGGQWVFTNGNPDTPAAGGKMICLWNENVQNKYKQCMQAIADAVSNYQAPDSLGNNFNPLEAIVMSESSIGGDPVTTQTSGATFPTFWEEKYSEGYYRLTLGLKTSFPQHVVGAFANFPRDRAGKMIMGGTFYPGGEAVAGFIAEGVGVAAPNVVSDDPGYDPNVVVNGWPGTHAWYDDAAGIVPVMPSWQKPDYAGTKLNADDPGSHVPTPDELYLYTKNGLFANYIIMTRTDESTYWADTKAYFTSTGIKNMINGGLASAKPIAYASINTN